jgi:predicted Fe-Mo cluster-binding NifX family protein
VRAAFATWNDRIAPVFDVARHVRLVEVEADRVVRSDNRTLPEGHPAGRVVRLAELGTTVLVCGAISRPLELMVAAQGIQVIPFVVGDLPEVIDAWIGGRLNDERFAMPGCCGQFQRRLGGRPEINDKEGRTMRGRGRGGAGGGAGRGAGGGRGSGRRPGQGAGRMGGARQAGPVGECVCPQCGHREAHELGIPCIQKVCPKCGTALTRE